MAKKKPVSPDTTFDTLAFHAFMENLPGLAWIIDAEGNFRYMNRRLLHLFGLAEQAVGKNISVLFPAEFVEKYLLNNQEVFETGRSVCGLEPALLPDGKILQFKVVKFLIGHTANGLLGGVGIDVTEDLQTARGLRELQKRLATIGHVTTTEDAATDTGLPLITDQYKGHHA